MIRYGSSLRYSWTGKRAGSTGESRRSGAKTPQASWALRYPVASALTRSSGAGLTRHLAARRPSWLPSPLPGVRPSAVRPAVPPAEVRQTSRPALRRSGSRGWDALVPAPDAAPPRASAAHTRAPSVSRGSGSSLPSPPWAASAPLHRALSRQPGPSRLVGLRPRAGLDPAVQPELPRGVPLLLRVQMFTSRQTARIFNKHVRPSLPDQGWLVPLIRSSPKPGSHSGAGAEPGARKMPNSAC